jgi:cytochrome c
MMRRAAAWLILALACQAAPAMADLRGHGGPVRSLAISQDGLQALSGSFDTSAILWNIETGAAERVLRLHEGSVNAVAFLPDGRAVTGGQDGRVALWPHEATRDPAILIRHDAPVAGLAVSADGSTVASASWDGTASLTGIAAGDEEGTARRLSGHAGNVNAVAFLPDGRLVSAGYDLTLRIWPLQGQGAPVVYTLPTPLNALVVAPDGQIVASGADGIIRLVDSDTGAIEEIGAQSGQPTVAMAMSADGARVAAASINGTVAIVDRAAQTVALTLPGNGTPVWSLAFEPNDGALLTGGMDRVVRIWDPVTGERLDDGVLEAEAVDRLGDSHGARVFRACAACHTLDADDGNRAGPTLHGIFGRPIASLPDYDYSPALRGMDIVWTPETVAELFDVGPNHYTPGTKMPEQRITSADDRAALIEFLQERTTR